MNKNVARFLAETAIISLWVCPYPSDDIGPNNLLGHGVKDSLCNPLKNLRPIKLVYYETRGLSYVHYDVSKFRLICYYLEAFPFPSIQTRT